MAVNQAKQLRQHKDGNQRGKLWDHLQQQEQHQPVLPPFKAEAGEGIGGKADANQGQHHGQEADFHRVPVPGKVIHIAIEQIGIVLERQIFRNDRGTQQAIAGVQRRPDGPDQRIDNHHRDQDNHQPGERESDPLFAFNTG